jgi:hypothetical protein
MPGTGIGPVRLQEPPKYKSGLFTSLSTQATVLSAEAAGDSKPQAASTWSGPLSTALSLFSGFSSFNLCLGDRRKKIGSQLTSVPQSLIGDPIFLASMFTSNDDVSIAAEPIQDPVSASFQLSRLFQSLNDFSASNSIIVSENLLSIAEKKDRIIEGLRTNRQRHYSFVDFHNVCKFCVNVVVGDCGDWRSITEGLYSGLNRCPGVRRKPALLDMGPVSTNTYSRINRGSPSDGAAHINLGN